MRCYLIGGRGRLGRAIVQAYSGCDITTLDRSDYQGWSQAGGAEEITRYFDQPGNRDAMVFVTSGLLDPGASAAQLQGVNYQLPRNLIEGAGRLGIRVITFGTVMEQLQPSGNAYVQSKAALGLYAAEAAAQGLPVIHLQLHTLYGVDAPSPFMFLGQILKAIQDDAPFHMSSGRQLREYHHFADVAAAIQQVCTALEPGVAAISHGQPLSLLNIAEAVFGELGKPELLHTGSLNEPPGENYQKVMQPGEFLRGLAFRDSLTGIVSYLRECLHPKQAGGYS